MEWDKTAAKFVEALASAEPTPGRCRRRYERGHGLCVSDDGHANHRQPQIHAGKRKSQTFTEP